MTVLKIIKDGVEISQAKIGKRLVRRLELYAMENKTDLAGMLILASRFAVYDNDVTGEPASISPPGIVQYWDERMTARRWEKEAAADANKIDFIGGALPANAIRFRAAERANDDGSFAGDGEPAA